MFYSLKVMIMIKLCIFMNVHSQVKTYFYINGKRTYILLLFPQLCLFIYIWKSRFQTNTSNSSPTPQVTLASPLSRSCHLFQLWETWPPLASTFCLLSYCPLYNHSFGPSGLPPLTTWGPTHAWGTSSHLKDNHRPMTCLVAFWQKDANN